MDKEEHKLLGEIKGKVDSLEVNNTRAHNEIKKDLKEIKECQIEQGNDITTVNQVMSNHLSDHEEAVQRTRLVFIALGSIGAILGTIATLLFG